MTFRSRNDPPHPGRRRASHWYGMAASTYGFSHSPFLNRQGFDSQRTTVVARYPNQDVVASGWLKGEEFMAGAPLCLVDMNPGRHCALRPAARSIARRRTRRSRCCSMRCIFRRPHDGIGSVAFRRDGIASQHPVEMQRVADHLRRGRRHRETDDHRFPEHRPRPAETLPHRFRRDAAPFGGLRGRRPSIDTSCTTSR